MTMGFIFLKGNPLPFAPRPRLDAPKKFLGTEIAFRRSLGCKDNRLPFASELA